MLVSKMLVKMAFRKGKIMRIYIFSQILTQILGTAKYIVLLSFVDIIIINYDVGLFFFFFFTLHYIVPRNRKNNNYIGIIVIDI